MNRDRRVVVGSRGSRLALAQARSVVSKLVKLHPGLRFEIAEVTTSGDRQRQTPLQLLGGEGLFVKELEESLLEGKIDMAVHSAKDLPSGIPEGLRLAAVPERVDARDAIVSRSGGLGDLPSGARVGTGSQRRAVQVLAQRPDVQIRELRGNIDTRLRKLSSGEYDCIVVAAAALIRLGLEKRITEYLAVDCSVPAVGQGALAIEIRDGDERTAEIANSTNDGAAWLAVLAEREFLRSLGGGCRAPIAAFGSVADGTLLLHGMVASPVVKNMLRVEMKSDLSDAEEAGRRLARRMLEMGAGSILGMDSA